MQVFSPRQCDSISIPFLTCFVKKKIQERCFLPYLKAGVSTPKIDEKRVRVIGISCSIHLSSRWRAFCGWLWVEGLKNLASGARDGLWGGNTKGGF